MAEALFNFSITIDTNVEVGETFFEPTAPQIISTVVLVLNAAIILCSGTILFFKPLLFFRQLCATPLEYLSPNAKALWSIACKSLGAVMFWVGVLCVAAVPLFPPRAKMMLHCVMAAANVFASAPYTKIIIDRCAIEPSCLLDWKYPVIYVLWISGAIVLPLLHIFCGVVLMVAFY